VLFSKKTIRRDQADNPALAFKIDKIRFCVRSIESIPLKAIRPFISRRLCRGDFQLDHAARCTDSSNLAHRSGGEIGRRARLRIWFRKECGFESHPEHSPSPTFGEPDEFSVGGWVKILFETNETFSWLKGDFFLEASRGDFYSQAAGKDNNYQHVYNL
jgi:hypothetical protein